MTRGQWIKKLETIISRVEAGQAPARIREIHVFGSFARGALEPNDRDLIVVHDQPTEGTRLFCRFLAASRDRLKKDSRPIDDESG
jgi:predicted nucleotidyltransferase